MKYPGFEHDDKIIYYIDPQGKDISFDRWRVTLYYHSGYAATHFLPDVLAYNKFLADNTPKTYPEYTDFRNDWEK